MLGKGWAEVRVGFRVIIYIYIVWDTLAGSLEVSQAVLRAHKGSEQQMHSDEYGV